ncbi:MAG TPA: hypothetical protein VK877_09705, partial [Pseudolabrys sp.]|nr:hypothetical protein [Pseudolabrys sp.]
AASTISLPASAAQNDEKKQVAGFGILGGVAGPAAIFAGTSSGIGINSITLVKNFKFYWWQDWGWHKVHYLKTHGWTVEKDFHYGKVKVHAEKQQHTPRSSNQGKLVVGCIMGSAFGAITAAIRKGNALGNPLRWRSQAEHEMIVKSGYEKQFELTNNEAAIALSFCGLGSLALNWQKQQAAPAVVKAKY